MILVVGLGNPGKKYKLTRHNLGFQVIDAFHNKNRDTSNFSDFRFQKELNSFISKGKFNDEKIILAKPQTFMNLSGKAVKTLTKIHHLTPTKLIIIHDDIDLPLGKIRIVKNRGAAGHKGVESIIRELGRKDFVRFRVGINRLAQNQKPSRAKRGEAGDETKFQQPSKIKNKKLDEFVLENFSKNEEKIVKEVIKKTVEAIELAIKEGVEKAMSKHNC